VSAPIPIEIGILSGSESAPPKVAQQHKNQIRTVKETVKPSQQPEALSQSAVTERPLLKQEEITQTVTGDALKADQAEPIGSIVGPLFNVDYLRNPKPAYPLIARRLRLEGTTIVRVLVSPAGKAEIVQLGTSSGSNVLDQAALNAVREWSFVPARQGNQPVSAWVDVPVRFRLTE
jgi:protein TonB